MITKNLVFYSQYRRRIPDSFSRTIFNSHREMIECGEAEGKCSNIYFFFPYITDRSKYLNNVSIFLVDITQSWLNALAGANFDPSKLDLFGLKKNTMADAVVKCLKHIMRFRIVTWSEMPTVRIRSRFRCRALKFHNDFYFRNSL